MNKIPTAEEWLLNHKTLSHYQLAEYDEGGFAGIDEKKLYEIMVEFAKLHVQAALQAVSDNAKVEIIDWKKEGFSLPGLQPIYGVNSESVLTAYPLENIK